VRFPKRIKHRGRVLATIYGRCKGRDSYRVAWNVAGQRRMASFPSYALAKGHADALVKDLAQGSQVTALQPAQARDALAALERLETLRQSSGRRFSLLAAVSDFAEATDRLHGRTLGEAVEGYLRTVVSIQRKDINEAIEEFIERRRHKSQAQDGKRAQMSREYACHVAMWLREFGRTFPGTAVSELTKEHLDAYIKSHTDVAAKSRNDRRATVKMFLGWSVRKDYLPVNHRLFEADGLAREIVETAETDFYRPNELQEFLTNAEADLLPVIALGGLAGLRVEEIMRLEWTDVWCVEGHIQISARNAKTRQRRLVKVCSPLAQWLIPYREKTGSIWGKGSNQYQIEFGKLREKLKIPARRNGLRHAFCTYHFALYSDENLTAAQAGNSPAIIHASYKGLATKADAEKWFHVAPNKIPGA
jgi:integrase